ncbi:hypothetical protein TNCV_2164701 [Trichonephila clavipes]|nr:hypothetical protein TNCV_2164701 [Trichonephila clavipes]
MRNNEYAKMFDPSDYLYEEDPIFPECIVAGDESWWDHYRYKSPPPKKKQVCIFSSSKEIEKDDDFIEKEVFVFLQLP